MAKVGTSSIELLLLLFSFPDTNLHPWSPTQSQHRYFVGNGHTFYTHSAKSMGQAEASSESSGQNPLDGYTSDLLGSLANASCLAEQLKKFYTPT
jgi:hypothetical protein